MRQYRIVEKKEATGTIWFYPEYKKNIFSKWKLLSRYNGYPCPECTLVDAERCINRHKTMYKKIYKR